MFDWLFKAVRPEDPERAIERRRKEAHESGVVDAFLWLNFEHFRYFLGRTANSAQDWGHPWITEGVTDSQTVRFEKSDIIRLTVRGKQYVITAKHVGPYAPGDHNHMDFELTINGQLVLGVSVGVRPSEFDRSDEWIRPHFFVTAFIPGVWIDDVKQLAVEIQKLHNQRNLERSHELAKSQAERFGI